MIKNRTNILFLLLFIILLLIGFLWYIKIRKISIDLDLSSDEHILGQQFLSTIEKLKKTEVDVGFFDSPSFQALKDLTPVIDFPEVVGRANPFLPLQN